jgi:predicted O-linked N-acetylglucosamine transferase (SPINDLY family)
MSNDRAKAFRDTSIKKPPKAHDLGSTLARAVALHQSGLFADAQALYRAILRKRSNHFDALHLLGVLEHQSGNRETGERLIRRALLVNPRSAAAHSNLASLLVQARRLGEALASCDKAIALDADCSEAFCNRGHALGELKRFEEALVSYDRAIALRPDLAEAWNNRGNALRALDRRDEALASYAKAIALNPGYAEAFSNRGGTLIDLRRYDDAVTSYEAALAIKPGCADIWNNRGDALFELGRFDEARASFDRALALDPKLAVAWHGRANILIRTGQLAEALAACNNAVAMAPDSPRALTLLGQCHAGAGDMEQAVACYDRALAIQPDEEHAIASKIFALDFDANTGFAEHQAARVCWWQQIGSRIAAQAQLHHDNDRDPSRRIVLGYVSSDFRAHSAAFGLSPVLKNRDKVRFEVICYSCSPKEDLVTGDFQQMADRWRSASQWSDDLLAEQIRADKVDILIDLSGHSAGNRLRVFARKPAPIQVTAFGHSTGTGLPTIDYLFSDPVAIPAAARHLFAERIYELPCLIIIDPPPSELRSTEPSFLSKGHMTYGVFNRIDKISDDAVRVWAQILRSDRAARLLIKHHALDDPSIRLMLTERFVRHGISATRIDLAGSTARAGHLAAYRGVDICLDPFPQSGGVSTWEALHMGVPVVAKLGNGVSSRLSGAILSAIGMTDWVAAGDDEYVAIALEHASMPDRLRTMRRELPERIATSPGCSPAGYAKAVEDAYRAMWKDYCERTQPGAPAHIIASTHHPNL